MPHSVNQHKYFKFFYETSLLGLFNKSTPHMWACAAIFPIWPIIAHDLLRCCPMIAHDLLGFYPIIAHGLLRWPIIQHSHLGCCLDSNVCMLHKNPTWPFRKLPNNPKTFSKKVAQQSKMAFLGICPTIPQDLLRMLPK